MERNEPLKREKGKGGKPMTKVLENNSGCEGESFTPKLHSMS